MAITDILGQSGDSQDFILEIPSGNASYTPSDILFEDDGTLMCTETPVVTGGNIFIMSE